MNGINIVMKRINRRILENFLSFLYIIIFAGSVFIVSDKNIDIYETYRKYWTILGSLFYLIIILNWSIIKKEEYSFSLDIIFKGICLIGVFEALFALAQLLKILPTYNLYFAYTGSFDNPAIFAMLLSLCVPIAVYFGINNKKYKTYWWIVAFGLFLFIIFSESRSGMLSSLCATLFVLLMESDKVRKVMMSKHTLFMLIPIVILTLVILYKFKSDSANGRLLIWRVSMDMVADKPLLGFGRGGFLSSYMEYQAEYFRNNPESKFLQLADNVNNPFNEFILVLVNYGIVGIVVILVVLAAIFKIILSLNQDIRTNLLSISIGIIIWSLFSYPFSIHFIWIFAGLILLVSFGNVFKRFISMKTGIICILICAFLMILVFVNYKSERDWKIIEQRSLNGETDAMLSKYADLYQRLSNDGKFLYNYGAELHYSGHYGESLDVLLECTRILNDYDVQMLIGDDYQNIGDTLSAISRYEYANLMVPSRLLPQYYQMRLYLEKGDTVASIDIAKNIVRKEPKIKQSRAARKIINEANEIIY